MIKVSQDKKSKTLDRLTWLFTEKGPLDQEHTPGRIQKLATERLTKLGASLRNALGDRTQMSYQMTREDIEVIQMAAQILTEQLLARRDGVQVMYERDTRTE
jgi:hypothetical protein